MTPLIDPATDAGLWDGLDTTPDPWDMPLREASHRAIVANWGCCDAHGGARCFRKRSSRVPKSAR